MNFDTDWQLEAKILGSTYTFCKRQSDPILGCIDFGASNTYTKFGRYSKSCQPQKGSFEEHEHPWQLTENMVVHAHPYTNQISFV